MSMQDLMAAGSREIFLRLGFPATYSLGETTIETVVILREAVEVLGELGQVVDSRDEMSLLLQDIPKPKRNAVVVNTQTGTSHQLVEKLVRDGYYERWVVK